MCEQRLSSILTIFLKIGLKTIIIRSGIRKIFSSKSRMIFLWFLFLCGYKSTWASTFFKQTSLMNQILIGWHSETALSDWLMIVTEQRWFDRHPLKSDVEGITSHKRNSDGAVSTKTRLKWRHFALWFFFFSFATFAMRIQCALLTNQKSWTEKLAKWKMVCHSYFEFFSS